MAETKLRINSKYEYTKLDIYKIDSTYCRQEQFNGFNICKTDPLLCEQQLTPPILLPDDGCPNCNGVFDKGRISEQYAGLNVNVG